VAGKLKKLNSEQRYVRRQLAKNLFFVEPCDLWDAAAAAAEEKDYERG